MLIIIVICDQLQDIYDYEVHVRGESWNSDLVICDAIWENRPFRTFYGN